MNKTAFISGITGQDGAYLAHFLLSKGYKVCGGYRRTSSPNFWRLDELKIREKIDLIEVDILDTGNLITALSNIEPDEVYNLAAQSFVSVSFEKPVLTGETAAMGVTRILEAIRTVNTKIKFYQASSSEMFGKTAIMPQNENTPFSPRSPYAAAKLYGHWIAINYRESYNIFSCSGILFNHESPLRGTEFVTRKISDAVAKIKMGKQDYIEIGNINSKRDWGYAEDYVKGMWMMLQHGQADDFVLATNETHSVKEFIDNAFKYVEIPIIWKGDGIDESAINKITGKTLVKINPKFFRPNEVDILLGDYTKAKEKLGWSPIIKFNELVELMVKKDLDRI